MSKADNDANSGFDAKRFLAGLPANPGIYQMLDEKSQILYVGKAKNLKNRVSSYFRARGLNNKTLALVAKIANIQVTVTATEADALILEQNLIKQQRPPYNILLRDDKSYPYIVLSKHAYPRLSFFRGRPKPELGHFYGPYPSAGAVRESLNLLQKVFRVRQCEDSYFNNRSRPCLQYQIKRCRAPCVNYLNEEAYAEDVRHTQLFLSGQSQQLMTELSEKMEAASAALEFEQAALLRDQIQALQSVQQQQYMEAGQANVDVIALAEKAGKTCVHIIFVRDGRVLGSKSFFPGLALEDTAAERLQAFVSQYYLASERQICKDIIINQTLPEQALLEQVLAQRLGSKVSFSQQVRGHRAQWLKLAQTTAEQNLALQLASNENQHKRLFALQQALQLEALPRRMECFDISHSHGERTVASCVVFDQNGPLKSDYRRFNIDGITAGDDYAAMHQALSRRYKRVKEQDGIQPDILLIDGGKGQVSQAVAVMQELQLDDVLIIGVAKGEGRKAGLEKLILPAFGRVLDLEATDPALHLVQHIRDEAHRFAITGHKNRRDKARKTSVLESIPGIGAKRRRDLLNHFGGLQGVKKASVEEIMKVPSINVTLAHSIYDALH